MAEVTTLTPAAHSASAMLMATLALETIVDAVVLFQVRTGVITSPKITPQQRQELRAAVIQMLNEQMPAYRQVATRCALELLSGRHSNGFAKCSNPDLTDVTDALEAYRESLQSSPLAGVGAIR